MPMSYAGASVSAPAAGTDNSAVFFKALADHIFAQYNGHTDNVTLTDRHTASSIRADDGPHTLTWVRALTGTNAWSEFDMLRRMWLELVDGDYTAATFASRSVPITLATIAPYITGATSAATASKLFLRDSLGGGTLSSLALGMVAGSAYGLNVQGFYTLGHASGVNFELIRDSALATVRSLDKSGNQILAGTSTATAFIGNATSATQLNGFSASVTGTNNSVTFAAGTFVNTQGAIINVPATTINFASYLSTSYVPTTGNQWIMVSLNDTGTYVLTPGTLNGLEATAIAPANTTPVRTVLLRMNNTTILVNDDFTVLHGFLGTRPAASAYGSGASGGTPASIRTAVNDGTLADTWEVYVQPDIASRLTVTSATVVTLAAGSDITRTDSGSPVTVGVGSHLRTNTANVTATASGAAGQRYVIANTVPAGPGFPLVSPMPATNTTSAGQVLLGTCYWDGSTIQTFGVAFRGIDTGPLMSLPSSSVTQEYLTYAATGTDALATAGTLAPTTNFPAHTFYLPFAARAFVWSRARVDVALAATSDNIDSYVRFDTGSATQPPQQVARTGVPFPVGASAPQRFSEYLVGFQEISLNPGTHTVSQDWTVTSGATGTFQQDRQLLIQLYRA